MNSCVFIIMLSLLLLLLAITSASQLAAVEGDDRNGVIMNKCLDKERHALLHFKSQLQDPYESLSTWRADDDECCQWSGVTCSNQTGHITELKLQYCGLVGEVSHSLVNLTYFNHLDLSYNSFHGTIPSFISSMTRLSFLSLDSNSFHGTIPRSIGSLTELRVLDLSDNSLYGAIPPEFGNLTNLQGLYLFNVGRCRVENLEWLSHLSHLEGLGISGISLAKQNHWVDAILSLQKLSYLSLYGCELSQVMYPYSSSFLNSSSSIQYLYLRNNSLTSSMYPWLFPLTSNKLISLGLSNNMLHEIPKYLGNLCSLEDLYFDNNAVVGNLPEFLTNLSGCTSLALQELDASENQFTGSLSDELLLATTTASQLVAVGGDDRNGVIMNKCLDKERLALLQFKSQLQDPLDYLSSWRADDDECCQWSGVTCSNQTGHITELQLFYLGLVGEVSHSLVNLTHLNSLDLSANSFHGTIPTFIGFMTRLSYLGLHSNSFHGTIPRSIGSLTELRSLYLSGNSLSGAIPPEFANLTNLQVLYLGDAGRCRVENLDWLSHLSHLEELGMDGISLAKQNHWVDVILNLSNLSVLSLEGCELSQVMYPYSSSLLNSSSSSIQSLRLGNNSLTSSMYPWLFPLTSNKLIYLDLSNNMLPEIPKYLGNLCSLNTLYFDNNAAVGNLPEFLTNLSGCTSLALQSLDASECQFTGTLSDDIQKFSSLERLYLSHNQLNGSISEKLWELPRLLTLDVSYNNLTLPSTDHLSSLSSVKALYLSSCKLLGPRFPKWIQSLKNLTDLDLSNTGISDTVPLEFWDMWPSQLKYLNLSSNNITGKIPDLLSNFDNPSVIDLSSNRFYGPIPNVPSTLLSLDLSRNQFSGGISFLCQIVDGSLQFLDLSRNSFIGQLPDCLWRFQDLRVLGLGNNNLSGRLPPSIGSLIELEVLYLYHNNFSGELPMSLKNCTSLNSLNLGANKFTGNVPVWIGENLSGLYVLILRSNNFFGTIPLQSCQLANLQILDLSMNNLHGTIPSCLSNLTSMVQQGFLKDVPANKIVRGSIDYEWGIYVDHAMIEWQGGEREFFRTLKLVKGIDLSSNSLTGQIPYQITNLSDLISLNLSKNTLSREIPKKIGEMKKLLTLDLSINNLSGQIPSSMSQMTLLNDLHLSFNNLSGRIPSSTQLQSFQPSTYDGNSRLCGPPLTKKCPGDEESKVKPVIGKSEGDADEEWGWFYIGGGMGFATGLWIACGALLLNRRGRHVFFEFYDSLRDWVYVKVMAFIARLQKARLN